MTELKRFFQDLTLGRPQNVGPITVVPLISDQHFSFQKPRHEDVSNRGYGNLMFKNSTPDPVLVPAHTVYMTKRQSQDHATMEGLIVKKGETLDYCKATCVQQSTGGMMTGSQEKVETTLPIILRERAFNKRENTGDSTGYGRLWNDITSYNAGYGIRGSGGGHYEYFYDAFEKTMDEFVAEFELVYNQVGFIVFAKNIVYGIERFPSPGYLKSYYRSLIKGCYGAAIIDLLRQADELQLKGTINVPVNMSGSVRELKRNLARANERFDGRVKDVVTELIFGDRGKFEKSAQGHQTDFMLFENDFFVGNVLVQADGYPYFTFVAREAQLKGVRAGREFKI